MKVKGTRQPDFSGYATKAGVKCTDGRTIMPGAFKDQDSAQVPLVYQHIHNDPTNVLGHVLLESRDDGVYAYGYFNDTEKAKHAKSMVEHGDVNSLSIYANNLVERSQRVLHGAIREVSLVLAGANSEALIENVAIRHSDGDIDEIEDEAIIKSGVLFEADSLSHEDDADDEDDDDELTEETIGDIVDDMTDKQKEAVKYLVGQALETSYDDVAGDDDEDDEDEDDSEEDNEVTHSGLGEKMKTERKNVFEGGGTGADNGPVLTHSDVEGILTTAQRTGSMRTAVEQFALAHGIENIGMLFPEATQLTDTPEFYARRSEWVNEVLGQARKTPFSRVRTMWADITMEEARAKGYITGNMKKEEFFSIARRETTPTTIYKKQKLDRDDVVDITDFDVVAWLRAEMRVMLDEELARAVLLGDGRDPANEDKVSETNIRPIAKDHDLFTTTINVNIDDANSSVQEVIDAVVANRSLYRGSGMPTLYTTETIISKFLLLKDTVGRRIYKNLDEVANELRVRAIVPVEVMEEYDDIVGILVNMADYNIGADKGGEVNMFDDFDIDFNQQKYLLETRCSGALTKLKSAMVIKRRPQSDVLAKPTAPSYNATTGEITITDTAGVVYTDETDPDNPTSMTNSGGPYTVTAGEQIVVVARPDSGYYFDINAQKRWTFKRPAA